MASTLSSSVQPIPGYVAGTWDIDAMHSEVSFVVRHMVVSKVRGRFNSFEGTIVTGENPLQSSVEASIDATSVDTNQEQRDAHIRSDDFLDATHFPTLSFRSTAVRPAKGGYEVDGELTIRGVTQPVTLDVELNGFSPDLQGGTRIGFSAETEINRQDYGVSYNGPIPGADNAMVLSDKIGLNLEIEAVLRPAA